MFFNFFFLLLFDSFVVGNVHVAVVSFYYYPSFQAIKEYQKALEVLKSRKKCPDIWDLVVWEFSTTLYTIASLLQDHPPLELKVGNKGN